MFWGIAGSIIGLMGAIIGTCIPIARSESRREKIFLVRCAMVMWILIAVFLVALFTIPYPYSQLVWIPVGAWMTMGIRYINNRQVEIRGEVVNDGCEME
ncbi:MAG: hypothetical protein AAF939_05830 [Planctomycetota bacterium]